MTPAEKTKFAAIRELLEEIHVLKVSIDEMFQWKIAQESRLNDFTAGYETYVAELRSQRRVLEFQIRRVRNQIIILQNPDDKDIVASTEPEEPPVLPSEPLTPQENIPIQTQNDDVLAKKQTILYHFARFWHPDLIPGHSSPDLMTKLNVVFTQSKDEIEMLAAIPWDVAWEKPGNNEALGAQWERMSDWYDDLQIAQQRLEDRVADVEQHPFYPLLPEWEQHENKIDYFACLAEDERKEIHRLEETLRILQDRLKLIKKDVGSG
jgi:hypothetical protein